MRRSTRTAATAPRRATLGFAAGGLVAAGVAVGMPVRPAAAQTHPPLMPTQDATVTYSVQPEGAPAPRVVTVLFGAEGRMMRVNASQVQGQDQGYAVIDRARRSVTVVMNPQRSYVELGAKDDMHNPFLLDATMRFSRTGTATVAGLPCTTWAITAGGRSDTTACVTDSGIVLSERGLDSQGVRGELVATSVSLQPLPPSSFEPPPGFTRVAHTEGQPPGGGSPAGPTLGPPAGGPAQ